MTELAALGISILSFGLGCLVGHKKFPLKRKRTANGRFAPESEFPKGHKEEHPEAVADEAKQRAGTPGAGLER